MEHVIIGAGPAGVIAAETLARRKAGKVTLIAGEAEPPYSRMALPYLLAENVGEDGTHLRHGKDHFDKLAINLVHDRVVSLDGDKRRLKLDAGGEFAADRILIATGSTAARPPIDGIDLDGVENCWTLADARAIAARTRKGSSVVLMGAGFIGCIVLEALVARGVEVTVVEREQRMLPRMMDEAGGAMIKRWCEDRGVKVLTGASVASIKKAGKGLELDIEPGGRLVADTVVCATGVVPNIAFLDGSGIDTDIGVLVDHHLRTNLEGIYAAGDVAQGPELITGAREIHAIQPTASEHGRIAALNMAGVTTRYRGSLAMNVLNTLGLVSSSFGLWDGVKGGEETVMADADRFRYLRLSFDGDRLVGALALGLTQHVGAIRGLIQTGQPLGHWKERLKADPNRIMEAYLAVTQGALADQV